MSAFNIINVATINDGMATVLPSNTARTALNTAPAAGHVFEVGCVIAANVTGTAATATVELYDGTNYRTIAFQISVPGNATLIVVDKSFGINLVDTGNQASGGAASVIHVTSGTGSALCYFMPFKDLS